MLETDLGRGEDTWLPVMGSTCRGLTYVLTFFFSPTSLEMGLVLLNHRACGREVRGQRVCIGGEHCKEQTPPLQLGLGLFFFSAPSKLFHLYFYFLARNCFRKEGRLSFFRGSSAAHDTGARLPAPTSSHLVIQDPGRKTSHFQ